MLNKIKCNKRRNNDQKKSDKNQKINIMYVDLYMDKTHTSNRVFCKRERGEKKNAECTWTETKLLFVCLIFSL